MIWNDPGSAGHRSASGKSIETSTVHRLRPKLPGRNARAFDQAPELGPHDLGLDLRPLTPNQRRGKAAIGTGNYPLAPDDPGQPHDALGDQIGVLDKDACLRNTPGDHPSPPRQRNVPPDPP